ncbi:hypothetical protein Y032_0194g1446 [Ancylostoma ceylanicum]|uniref:Secreted protein n=1 Tax=Ancylostoma ceylanicum TaxID=53326 RepID=A0A016SQ45_9BILA|nr:hypothetical protein Y032_0194g1446 [Ancylostoma ceylanicum]
MFLRLVLSIIIIFQDCFSLECGRMSYYCTTTKTFGPTYTTSQRFKTVAELHDLECAAEKRPLFLGQPSI